MIKLTPIAAAMAAACLLSSSPALAQTKAELQELREMREEMKRLRAEVNELKRERDQARAAAPAAPAPDAALAQRVEKVEATVAESRQNVVTAGELPGSFKLPGSDTSIRLYGYAEMQAVHEFEGDNFDSDFGTFLPTAPLNGSTIRKNETLIHARTSRFGIQSLTNTSMGPVTARLEGDFNNDPRTGGSGSTVATQAATNSYVFRVRHAFGTFQGFTVGQTWSTFMDVDNAPNGISSSSPIGSTLIRQGLIRYTTDAGRWGRFSVAAENPNSVILNEDPSQGRPDTRSKWPDLVARWDGNYDWGGASLRAVTHEFKVGIDPSPSGQYPNGGNASERGYGVASTVKLLTRGGKDFLSLGLTYGDGIGRYFDYIDGAIYNGAANRIETERTLGIVGGYHYQVRDNWRANLSFGWQESFNNSFTDFALSVPELSSGRFGINKRLYQIQVGTMFSPAPMVDVGAEYLFGERETLVGEKGRLSRINLVARYTFN